MTQFPASPFLWLRCDEGGRLDPADTAAIQDEIASGGYADLVVISHGWKNEATAAMRLYSELWGNVAPHLANADQRLVVGIAWPSKRYPSELEAVAAAAQGGVQSATGASAEGDLSDDEFSELLTEALAFLKPENSSAVRAAAEAYVATRDEASAKALFLEGNTAANSAAGDAERDEDLASAPSEAEQSAALSRLESPLEATDTGGGTQGIGTAIGRLLQGPKAAVIRLLEQFSYWEMKRRAGVVGASVGLFLGKLDPPDPLRLHLVGHSFGARVVTSAIQALPRAAKVEAVSLVLLQGAFSHNGFSSQAGGAFADVPGRLSGPIAITHTHNDKACYGIYAWASRLSNDTTQGAGGADDRYGAMGANGAQKVRADQFTDASDFSAQPGVITNFLADAYIHDPKDAHGDVRNKTVGKLVAAMIA